MKDRQKERLKAIREIHLNYDKTDNASDQRLKTLNNEGSLNLKLYNQGEEWFKSGLSLEDAPERIRNNFNFVNGYERGRRLALIEEINGNKKTR